MQEGAGAFTRATGRTLERSAEQPNYKRYQFDLIAPHCGASVLEIGAGLGEFSSQFTGLERLVVTDVDPDAVAVLERRFADRPEVEVRQLDLAESPRLERPVDTVIAINVLEHIDDDVGALQTLAGLVVPGGNLVVWVPGYQQLYGEFDRKVGHVRRYTPTTLRAAATAAGLEVTLARPVNLLGGLAWWVSVRRGGTMAPKPGLVRVYDRFVVPATRRLEALVSPPFGQSVLCVARTPRS